MNVRQTPDGAAAAVPLADPDDLPLAGVRVVSVESYGAGPFGTLYLADLGAEVIKIETPASSGPRPGDYSRHTGPFFLGENDSHFFQTFNRNKKSVSLDLKKPEAREVFERLVATADAVTNNLKGDQPDKLGLTYERLGPIRPSIVCGHLSGFGRFGPRRSWPAYDYLIQAEAGFMALTGEPDGPPTRMGLSIVDYMSGMTLALAVTAALFRAARTGKGRDVDVTLYDVAIHQLSYPATWYLNEDYVTDRRPRSGHPSAVPVELFPTKDGHLFLMCVLPKFWEELARIVGLGHLVEDARFATARGRFENREALAALLDEALSAKTTAEWLSLMAGKVPAAPVLTVKGALDNPFLVERGGVQSYPHPARPEGVKMLASPIRMGEKVLPGTAAAPLGADTDAVLSSLGYGDADIARLRAAGAV